MDLGDRIRDAMAAHENEAPTAAEFAAERRVIAPAQRALTRRLPAVAAASAVLAVAIGVVVIRSGGDNGQQAVPAAGSLSCPRAYESSDVWVPAKPRGVDGASSLVPRHAPARAVICAYLYAPDPQFGAAKPTRVARTGGVGLGGDLSRVAGALSWLPPLLPRQSSGCLSYLAITDRDAYLIGLSYPTGTVWVSAPGNHCAGASNGVFATAVNLRVSATAAYAARRWTVDPSSTQSGDRDPCHVGTAGRLGQETAMVPGAALSATVCKLPSANQSTATATTVVKDVRALVTALNSLSTRPSTSACEGGGLVQSVIYEVLLRYSDGPPVFVRVLPNCHPSIDNLSLQADDSGAVVAMLKALLAGR